MKRTSILRILNTAGGMLALFGPAVWVTGCTGPDQVLDKLPDLDPNAANGKPDTNDSGGVDDIGNMNGNTNSADTHAGGSGTDELEAIPPSGTALSRLQLESATPVRVELGDKLPIFVEANVPIPDSAAADSVEGALSYFDKYKDLYNLVEPASQLFLVRHERDDDGDHLFFGQQRNGVVVHAAEIAIHMQSGRVKGTNGRYLPHLPVFGPEMLGGESARIIAAAYAGASVEAAEGVATKVFFNEKLAGGENDVTRLTWRTAVRGGCDTAGGCQLRQYFVDAHSGEVVWTVDLEHHCDKDFDIQTASGTSTSNCWSLPWETQDDYWFDEDGIWCGFFAGCAQPDNEGWAAYNSAHRVYDYFAGTFGRCGWDGDDAQLEAYVHSGGDANNASYNPGCDHLRFGNGMVTLDIFAHEFTHAITRWTAGLPGSFAGGAMNEHYSDVFAAIMDGNWQIGEGCAIGTLRDMSNPAAGFNHPDHMQAAQDTSGTGFRNLPNTAAGDSGGVHINNGILNKAASLIADGGAHKGFNIAGIGRDKLARLYYAVLTTRLTSNSQFIDERNATVAVARDWALNGQRNGFTMRDVCSVINAFASVGLGAQDLDCDGWDDNEDSDDDQDFVPDSRDNCRLVKNPFQEDNDRDGIGDACDNDDDTDSIVDSADNCRNTSNRDQSDRDGDGVGDACDNCPDYVELWPRPDGGIRRIANPDQTDTDEDGQGDLCDDDDDGDGVRDLIDNCPLISNPSQMDLNRDGIGTDCDEAEQDILGQADDPPPASWFKIKLCAGGCPNWILDRYRSRINVLVDYDVSAAIVDQHGTVVAKAREISDNDGTVGLVFNLRPEASFRYRFPASASRFVQGMKREDGRAVLESKQYFLRLHATGPNHEAVPAEPISMEVGALR